MKFSIAIVFLSISVLITSHCVQSKKHFGFLDSIETVWGPLVRSAKNNMHASATTLMLPLLEVSKRFMDPTGREMVDKIIADIPNYTIAWENNDMMAIHRGLNDSQKVLDLLPQHITSPHFHKLAIERIHAFKNVVACINQGGCGCQYHIYFIFDCVDPMKTFLSSSMSS